MKRLEILAYIVETSENNVACSLGILLAEEEIIKKLMESRGGHYFHDPGKTDISG